ncbi:hypothetical protein GPECTOR_140g679 [Gonium pectorale]|uniref:Uncharacterized protein n=1 Tax=Gonium pectorale TaxID=33097 RepID=A0A150FY06_GONPE|nr:hypothetical protein GPECTOR_140g679 [Gonium pectorale]|eukprot:KXZ42503.1 hypothetical protein GPECTOR_140g679 [Gonium pectorale]
MPLDLATALPCYGSCLLAAAAASNGPDWHQKLSWLVGRGVPRTGAALWGAATSVDGLERVRTLRAEGWPSVTEADVEAVLDLDTGGWGRTDPFEAAALRGDTSTLEGLVAMVPAAMPQGGVCGYSIAGAAAAAGHLHVLKWMHVAQLWPSEAQLHWDVGWVLEIAQGAGDEEIVRWMEATFGTQLVDLPRPRRRCRR